MMIKIRKRVRKRIKNIQVKKAQVMIKKIKKGRRIKKV